jgi:hypothetical protein
MSDIDTGYLTAEPLRNLAYKLTIPLLILAMILLLFEWWYYAKRNYI